MRRAAAPGHRAAAPAARARRPAAPSPREPFFAAIVLVVGTVTPLNNTSLKLNSVGFYQLAKVGNTPMDDVADYLVSGDLRIDDTTTLISACTP